MPFRSTSSLRSGLRRASAVVALAVAATTAGVAAGVAPAHAAEAPTTFFTMIGGGDWVGGNKNQVFHAGNATFEVSGTASALHVKGTGGTFGTAFTLDMSAPPGQTLVPGTYDGATRHAVQQGTRPGLSVTADNGGCGTVTGRFVVHDMAVGGDGVINRFSATYEHLCNGPSPLIGQISINQPRDAALLVAGDVDWPEQHVEAKRTVPVWVYNPGPAEVPVTGAAIGGADAASFAITSNDCGALAAGATCVVYVRYQPATRGTAHAATLTVSASTAAASYAVALTGRSVPGHTALHLRGEYGNSMGGEVRQGFTPATSTFSVSGTTGGFSMSVKTGSFWWYVTLKPPATAAFVPGMTYTGAAHPATTTGPAMDVSSSWGRCSFISGEFTIVEATFKDGTGPLEKFAATFVQYCDGASAPLRGWVSWRATEPNEPPPGPLPAPRDLLAFAQVTSVQMQWTNPPGATGVIVRGANGLTPPASPTAGWAAVPGATLRTSAHVPYLTQGASYSFSVFARDAGGNVSPAATATLRGTSVTLRPNAAAVTYGSQVRLTATVLDAVSGLPRLGQDVDLFARKKGTYEYVKVKRLVTNSSGIANFWVTPVQGSEYHVVHPGSSFAMGAFTGAVLVDVRTRVTAALSRTSVARNGAVTVSGAVAPAKAGKTVYLQRYVSGAWRTITSKALSTTSTYAFTIRPSTAGTWRLRVYRPADSAHVAGVSATKALTVT